MSSQPDNAIDELVAFYAAVQPGGYCGVAVTALIVYDWVVTLPRELQLFWTGKARPLSSILYFTNKYLNLLAQVINLVEYGPISDELHESHLRGQHLHMFFFPSTSSIRRVEGICIDSQSLAIGVHLSVVEHAVCHKYSIFRFRPLRYTGSHGGVHGKWDDYFLSHPNMFVTWSLFGPLPRKTDITSTVFLTNRISTILAETLLIAITWRQFRHEGSGLKINRSEALKTKGLAWVMLCDGLIYFIVLLFLNITNLVLTELAESAAVNGNVSLLARFASPLSSLLVSHFLLDLQDAHQRKAVGLDTDDPLYTLQSCNIRSAYFVPTLGSLGAVIEPAHYSREEHDAAEFFVDVDLSEVPVSAPSGEGAFSQDSRTEDGTTLSGSGLGGSGLRVSEAV
uniref:Cytochrome P450 monooxygenase CYP52X1 n=1 Tax=Ganoderma boninense TaxID=34458 RepID=A0A5K1JWN7_9APHY|nr:Cytochrome P450 monooxygenase CYP52X1 [Ganoderma boninense]